MRDVVQIIDQLLQVVPEGKYLRTQLGKLRAYAIYVPPELQLSVWADLHSQVQTAFGMYRYGDLDDWQKRVVEITTNRRPE